MKFEKRYFVRNWEKWSDDIKLAIEDFFATYSYYPNILSANAHTFSQFDFIINIKSDERERVSKINDETGEIRRAKEDEQIEISSFESEETTLDFAEDNKMQDKEFALIYDSDPDWGDDDINDNSPIEEMGKSRRLIKVY